MTLIAARANVCQRTVRRFLDGETKAHPITEQAILDAAKVLKIDLKTLRRKAV
jgi:DNA-binding LacI/PurR family transcriptional regulator